MQRMRESLATVLLAVLPFHAFLVTIGTRMLAGTGHAPLPMLAVWKEALLGVLLVVAFIEWLKTRVLRIDLLDALILVLLILSVVVTAMTHGDLRLYLIGFKYDFVPLVAFLILRRVSWSDAFFDRICRVLLAVGGIVAAYGIIGMYLPQSFFVWLGYSDLHSLYQAHAPLAAFQQIGGSGIRRIQSVMSGPNQLGLWLLLPFCIALVRGRSIGRFGCALGSLVLLAIFLSLSRSALVASAVIITVLLWQRLPRAIFLKLAGVLFAVSLVLSFAVLQLAPEVVVRAASTSDHISRPLQAMGIMVDYPLGLGLGTAGPASNRVSDTCVYLGEGDDPSWAQPHEHLCVFVGETQVQPEGRACSCPFLSENWYLQIGVEMGILGFIVFALLTFVVLRRLHRCNDRRFIFLAMLGIVVASLFLHAWEDGAVAYTLWLLAAAALSNSSRVMR